MKLRSFLAVVTTALVLLILAVLVLNYPVTGEFDQGLALGATFGGVFLVYLLKQAGGPGSIFLRRDMGWDQTHGRCPIPTDQGGSNKSQRTFASTMGGHVATLASRMNLVSHGAGGRPRLIMARHATA